MDIYEMAKTMSADYMDMNTGYIYKIQEYNQAMKFGLPTPGIRVTDSDGNTIGYARKIKE